VALVVPLLYPLVAVIAPGWTYNGPFNWSSRVDAALQGVGLGLWAAGVIVLVWAARVLGGYVSQDGVAEGHELVAAGPYRYVRHPVYGSFTAIAVGLGLVSRSYLLVGVAAVWLAASLWWRPRRRRCCRRPRGWGRPTAATANGPAGSYPG
jgi:protein-S-isoprenylcysteine O-methyltransferase Ste14